MTSESIFAWAVFNPKAYAGLRWRVFKTRQIARDFRRQNGGALFKIASTH